MTYLLTNNMIQIDPHRLYTTQAIAQMKVLPYRGLNGVRRCINAGYNGNVLPSSRVGSSGHWRIRGSDLLTFLSSI
tara:strand:+ start:524 stop:751 length:228 start_codon:yes stop_codon:yes gene_type:complete